MGILGAPDVDWGIAVDGGQALFVPGGTVRATISLRPRQNLDARRVMAALVGTEEYQYSEREYDDEGSSSSTSWGSSEVGRQEVQLMGPGTIIGGVPIGGPVELAVPPAASPSFESKVLRVRWELVAWVDVGGRDPKLEQPIAVALTAAQLDASDAASMGPQVQLVSGGQPVSLWAQPAPLRSGAPFSGALDVMTALPLADAHAELRLNAATSGSGGLPVATLLAIGGISSTSRGGVSDSQVLWRGGLTDGGMVGTWHRYLFAGQVPPGAVTAVFPHGSATATLDIVISRRLRPDAHITRPVAIVSG